MNRLECLGKSSTSSQTQLVVEVASANAKTIKPNDKVGKKTVTDKPRRNLPAQPPPQSVQVSSQETQKFPVGEVLDTNERPPKESINIIQRVEEHTQAPAVAAEELKMKDLRRVETQDSAAPTGMTTQSPPPAEPIPTREEEEQTEEEDVDGEDIKAPLELVIEFLRAVMDRDFQLASRLCQMVLIYEPENPEASEIFPLIQKKLLEEQQAEQSTEEEEEEDDDEDSDETGSDEESSQSSSCSSSCCSSTSTSDDDEE